MKQQSLPRRTAVLFAMTLLVAGIAPAQKTAPKTAEPAKGADRIVREVRHELVMLPYYGVFDDLEYKVEGNTVTLMGEVRSLGLKNAAEKAVKDIEGVERVENKIEMLPPNTADDQIRLVLYNKIYGQPSLQRYALQAVPSIHIIVRNGAVTLTGVVLNDLDKQVAYTQANSTPGIFRVTNNLRTEQPAGGVK